MFQENLKTYRKAKGRPRKIWPSVCMWSGRPFPSGRREFPIIKDIIPALTLLANYSI